MGRKLISSKEEKISIIQFIGFGLILLGIIAIIISVLFGCPCRIASIIAVAFFITMLGVAFAFPSLLEGNDGLSTMRIVVFMMVNVICLLLIKIGWNKTYLEAIGLDQWWMGVIAFVFGAKATQSYFESKLAVPKENSQTKSGVAALEFSNAEIAKLAVMQNEQYLKVKFSNIVSLSDAVHDLTQQESHVVAIYLKDNNSSGIPDKLEVKLPGGDVKMIGTEIVKDMGEGELQINQNDRIQTSGSLSFGSICCMVDTNQGFNAIVTAGHVFSNGNALNYNGLLRISDQKKVEVNDIEIGTWFFQLIDFKNDIALAKIDNWLEDGNYISFKEHYEVSDKDIKQTKVNLISFVSKKREGYILDHNKAWNVPYNKLVQKNNVILIGSTMDRDSCVTCSQKGDSGGCVYESKTGQLVGIILGGNKKFTWVLPLKEIFKKNNYKLI